MPSVTMLSGMLTSLAMGRMKALMSPKTSASTSSVMATPSASSAQSISMSGTSSAASSSATAMMATRTMREVMAVA